MYHSSCCVFTSYHKGEDLTNYWIFLAVQSLSENLPPYCDPMDGIAHSQTDVGSLA